MRRAFLAGLLIVTAVSAAVVATMDSSLPWQESASAGSTAPALPAKPMKLCRSCGVIKEIDEVQLRGEGRRYDITVRTEDGLLKIVSIDTRPVWRVGDKVRVLNGRIRAL